MYERYTDRARRVLVLAMEEARDLGHNYLGDEHLLLGLSRDGEGIAAQALESFGITTTSLREMITQIVGPIGEFPNPLSHLDWTTRGRKVLELALRESLQLGHNFIGTEHLLLAIVREGQGIAAQALENLGAQLPQVRFAVIRLLSGFQPAPPHRIQRKRAKGWRMPEGAVNVTRPSEWSNPFKIGDPLVVVETGVEIKITRDLAVALFEAWIHDKGWEDQIRQELAGKNLVCWCKPTEDCHADVLLRIANPQPEKTGLSVTFKSLMAVSA